MRVSVVMSVYEEPFEWLEASIMSILNQTYENFEFVIVLDNPILNDSYLSFINSSFADERLLIITNEHNLGLALSLNKAIKFISTGFVVRMDADDLAISTRIERLVGKWKKTKADVICSNYSYLGESYLLTEPVLPKLSRKDVSKNLVRANYIHHPTVMFTRDMFLSVNGYNDYPCAQDKDLWLRMALQGATFDVINEVLLNYRVHANSISQSKKLLQQITMDYIKKELLISFWNTKTDFDKSRYNRYCDKRGAFVTNNIQILQKSRDLMILRNNIKKSNLLRVYLAFRILVLDSFVRRSLLIDTLSIISFHIQLNFKKTF